MLEKLMKWNSAKASKWEKVRSRGKRHFVLIRGVLGWGLVMFLFMTVFSHFQKTGFKAPSFDDISITIIVINAVIWPIAGFVWGACTWSITDKSYLKYIRNEHDPR